GLTDAYGVAVSPDGASVYVASKRGDALAVFSRDAVSGALTFVQAKFDGKGPVNGLDGAEGIAISPDGAYVYVAGRNDDALAVFGRNPETGMLTSVQLLQDGVGGVNGLNGADSVAVSPDGTHVLVTGSVDNALAVFQRDAATGTLTYVERLRDGTAGVDGLHNAQALAISPDGASVYATGSADNAVAVFHVRRCGDGVLDPGEQCDDGNVLDGDCCSSTCQFEPATTICRPAAGACDVAERCDGVSDDCPADTKSTAVCRPAAGACDVAERCDGVSDDCPADTKSTAVCRPAAGACDVAERCDGVSDECPADA